MASNNYQTAISVGLISAIVALSLVVLTGYVGQISLAQMTFAGLGAYFCSRFADDMGIPFPFSIIVAGLATGIGGVILGLPALRVRGVNLAVITLGAAVAVDSLVFNDASLTGANLTRAILQEAELVHTGRTPDLIAPFALERFYEDKLVSELAAAAVSH